MNEAPTTSQVAVMPVLWIGAAAVFAVIIAQCVIYLKAARRAAPEAEMTSTDFRTAFRTGGLAAVGPSLAVCLVAMALLAIFGAPSTMARFGLVGSAAFDAVGAKISAETMGAKLGGQTFTPEVLVTVLIVLSLGACGWMLTALIITPIMKRGLGTATSAKKRKSSALAALLPTAALVGVFFTMSIKEVAHSGPSLMVFLVSAGVMGLCTFVARRFNKPAFLEWALGLAIIAAIAAAYFTR
ncbi:DUF5058 family protein [Arthrobacter sp. MMS18-M83]|uniref:DUF5058 family protein n=1 Tax=Arthrobacter sp. MMS18-M83 TaxID=2996261 RepID=UPI00227CB1A4|nr:DUF5058 family protein [Arthrobacter sp. MMS18-M83]WAH97770.1 DUF5058 family protein [Arthrobacter sp. MMS18-M83]